MSEGANLKEIALLVGVAIWFVILQLGLFIYVVVDMARGFKTIRKALRILKRSEVGGEG